MKDILGQEIERGDEIVFSNTNTYNLTQAIVRYEMNGSISIMDGDGFIRLINKSSEVAIVRKASKFD